MILQWLQPQSDCWFWNQENLEKQITFYSKTLEFYQFVSMVTTDKIERFKNQIIYENNTFIIHFLEILLMAQTENQNPTNPDILILITNQIKDYKMRIQTANKLLDEEFYVEPKNPELTLSNQSMLESVISEHEKALMALEKEKSRLSNKVFA
jgi:hypothetical protein